MINGHLLIIIKRGVTKKGVGYSEEDMGFLLKNPLTQEKWSPVSHDVASCRHGEIPLALTLFPLIPFAPFSPRWPGSPSSPLIESKAEP